MDDIVLGDESVLKRIVRKKVCVEFGDDDFKKAEEDGFVFGCFDECDDNPCKCFGEERKLTIRKIKDQVIAYKVINYLVKEGSGINGSHWRTEWRRTNDPDFVRKPKPANKPKPKMYTQEEMIKMMTDEGYVKRKRRDEIKVLEEKRRELTMKYQDLQKEYTETLKQLKDLKLVEGDELDDELLNVGVNQEEVREEFQNGGGVDQGELEEDPYYEEEPPTFQDPPTTETEEEETPAPNPHPQKKKGRPKKITGEVVGQIVERLEGQV